MSVSREGKIVLLVALFGASVILFCGVSSDVYRGDEPYHYRVASLIYETKSRPVSDIRHHFSSLGHRPLSIEMLWHAGLASLWWTAGGKSQILAQLYQATWYFFLVIATYLLAKQIYDSKESLYSALIVATIPASSAYTILLYTDIPVTVLSLFCFFFLIKRRYVVSGIFLGLMILMKRNAYLFIPVAVFWVIYSSMEIPQGKILTYESLKTLLKSLLSRKCLINILLFLVPA